MSCSVAAFGLNTFSGAFTSGAFVSISKPLSRRRMNDIPKQSWWRRLSGGLKRTSASIGTAISDIVSKRKLDAAMIGELEELLIRADLGVNTAARIPAAIGQRRHARQVSESAGEALLPSE